jgi:hypothetical protein
VTDFVEDPDRVPRTRRPERPRYDGDRHTQARQRQLSPSHPYIRYKAAPKTEDETYFDSLIWHTQLTFRLALIGFRAPKRTASGLSARHQLPPEGMIAEFEKAFQEMFEMWNKEIRTSLLAPWHPSRAGKITPEKQELIREAENEQSGTTDPETDD